MQSDTQIKFDYIIPIQTNVIPSPSLLSDFVSEIVESHFVC